jgi:photosystem II stability/assembly factor-like uncharacterized protein
VKALAVLASVLAVGGAGADIPRDFQVYRIAFTDARHGVLSTAKPNTPCPEELCRFHVYATSDGGATWRRTLTGVLSAGHVAHLSAAPGTRTFFVSYPCVDGEPCKSRLHRSDDAGRTWRRIAGAWIWNPAFSTPRHGWAMGRWNAFVETHDGGLTWRRVRKFPCPEHAGDWYFPALASASRGWVLCRSHDMTVPREKAVYETVDGGRTWRLRSAFGEQYGRRGRGLEHAFALRHLSFRPSGRGWIWRWAGAPLVTGDGGLTWRESTSRWPYSLIWASGVTDGLAFALVETTQEQRLVRTFDAGRTWRVVHRWPK